MAPSAMILSAGFGTRLRPVTDVIPKPLVPVGDRPAFIHAVDQLRFIGASPLIMNTHHRAESFSSVLPPELSVKFEETILGTAGGVRNAESSLGRGDIIVWNGDVVAEPDLWALLNAHLHHLQSSKASVTLLASSKPVGQGTLGISSDGFVVRLRGECFGTETRAVDFMGIQILSAEARARLPLSGCLIGDLILPMLREGAKVPVFLHDQDWDDIGNPQALLKANLRWLKRTGLSSYVNPNANVDSGVRIHNSVVCAGGEIRGQGLVEKSLILPGAFATAPCDGIIALPPCGGRDSIVLRIN